MRLTRAPSRPWRPALTRTLAPMGPGSRKPSRLPQGPLREVWGGKAVSPVAQAPGPAPEGVWQGGRGWRRWRASQADGYGPLMLGSRLGGSRNAPSVA